jgi:hypothetical protein
MNFCRLTALCRAALAVALAAFFPRAECFAADKGNVAVIAYVQQADREALGAAARVRLEQLLSDNGYAVLDEDKAKELRSGYAQMSDPTFLLTAEEFEKISRQYRIDRIYRVHLSADATRQFGFYSATAHVALRRIGANSAVESVESMPMGVKGFPPSDGLTDSAALVNASQRALDSAAIELGLRVPDEILPRIVNVELRRANAPSTSETIPDSAIDKRFDSLARLHNESRKREAITCRALSPDGGLAALAGYEHYTTFIGGMKRQYGSRLHVVDTSARQEIAVLEMHPIANREAGENGTSEVLDCRFLGNWRFFAAVTGNKLSVWDVERGKLLAEEKFSRPLSRARIELRRSDAADYLSLTTSDGVVAYSMSPKR